MRSKRRKRSRWPEHRHAAIAMGITMVLIFGAILMIGLFVPAPSAPVPVKAQLQ